MSARKNIDRRRVVSFESPGMRRVLKVIEESEKPIDGYQIAAAAFISFNTFDGTYRQLLLRAKKVHVAAYRVNHHGPAVPLYRIGPLKGKPPERPKADHKIAVRAWKERTGYYEAEKAKRRLARPPDPALAAMLGLTPRYGKTYTTTPAAPAERNTAP